MTQCIIYPFAERLKDYTNWDMIIAHSAGKDSLKTESTQEYCKQRRDKSHSSTDEISKEGQGTALDTTTESSVVYCDDDGDWDFVEHSVSMCKRKAQFAVDKTERN